MNASSDLAIACISYPTNAASCSLVMRVRGCLCKNKSKSRSQALRTAGTCASRRLSSFRSALDGFEIEIEPPPRGRSRWVLAPYTTIGTPKTVADRTEPVPDIFAILDLERETLSLGKPRNERLECRGNESRKSLFKTDEL